MNTLRQNALALSIVTILGAVAAVKWYGVVMGILLFSLGAAAVYHQFEQWCELREEK